MDRHFAQTQDCVCRKFALTEFTTGDGRDHTSRFNLGVVCPYDFLNLYRSGLNFHWCTDEQPELNSKDSVRPYYRTDGRTDRIRRARRDSTGNLRDF